MAVHDIIEEMRGSQLVFRNILVLDEFQRFPRRGHQGVGLKILAQLVRTLGQGFGITLHFPSRDLVRHGEWDLAIPVRLGLDIENLVAEFAFLGDVAFRGQLL